MDWREEYKRKLVAPEEAVKVIKSGDRVVFGQPDPLALGLALADRAEELKEVRIQGIYGYTKREFESSIRLASANRINLKQLITHLLPLEEIAKGFEILAQKKNAIKIVIEP